MRLYVFQDGEEGEWHSHSEGITLATFARKLHKDWKKNGSRGKGNSSLASRLDYLVLSEDGPLYITLWFTSVTPIGIFSIITSPFSGKPLNMKKDKIFRIPVQFHRRIHFHVVFEKNGLNNRLALGTPTFVVGAPSPCEI